MKKQIEFSGAALPAISDEANLVRYLRMIQQFPILSKAEEFEYASDWVKNRSKISAEKLVSAHLRLVASMAYELRGYGIPVGELIASGNVGLMQALHKFEPEKGFRFSTYAAFWIRAEMYDLILNNWSLVKLGSSAARKKIFFNLARTKRALGITGARLSDDEARQIAEDLSVSESDVMDISGRLRLRDSSLNVARCDGGGGEMLDLVPDDKKPFDRELEDHEAKLRAAGMLRRHLAELPGRDREILVARRLLDPVRTLEDLSAHYGISRERVRQIEERAFARLREAVLAEEGELEE